VGVCLFGIHEDIFLKKFPFMRALGAADVLEYVGSWPYVVPPVHRIKPGRLTQTDSADKPSILE